MDIVEMLVAGHRDIVERKDLIEKLDAVVKNEPEFWQHAANVSAFFRKELREHMELEEKVLFPVMKKALPAKEQAILKQILAEHAPILKKLNESERLFGNFSKEPSQQLKESLLASYIHVMDLILSHAKLEDERLFPLVSRYFGEGHIREMEKLYFERLQG